MRLRRVCVYAGSSAGARDSYAQAAAELANALVDVGLGVVYGGGQVGLMGVLADAVLSRGGEIIGVIPEPLFAREIGHQRVTDLRVVGSMHERKALMAELADALLALVVKLRGEMPAIVSLRWPTAAARTAPARSSCMSTPWTAASAPSRSSWGCSPGRSWECTTSLARS